MGRWDPPSRHWLPLAERGLIIGLASFYSLHSTVFHLLPHQSIVRFLLFDQGRIAAVLLLSYLGCSGLIFIQLFASCVVSFLISPGRKALSQCQCIYVLCTEYTEININGNSTSPHSWAQSLVGRQHGMPCT